MADDLKPHIPTLEKWGTILGDIARGLPEDASDDDFLDAVAARMVANMGWGEDDRFISDVVYPQPALAEPGPSDIGCEDGHSDSPKLEKA